MIEAIDGSGRPVPPADLLQVIQAVVTRERPLSALYLGKARLDVLRLLVKLLPRGAVQAIDYDGRGIGETHRFELYHHGVGWWDEFGGPVELEIRDAWTGHPDSLRLSKRRVWILADNAVCADLPTSHRWERIDACMVGVDTKPNGDLWRQLEKRRHDRIKDSCEWLRRAGYSVPGDPPDSDHCKSDYDIPAGTPHVTCAAWQTLDPQERERRERGATMMKYDPFHAERAPNWDDDEYWAKKLDEMEYEDKYGWM